MHHAVWNLLLHVVRNLLLHDHVVWAAQCWCDVPTADATHLRPTNWLQPRVYVDDIIVKSTEVDQHIEDLAETFANLNRHNIKLNPEKCVFGVQSGKVLGYMAGASGIDANLEMIEAIDHMHPLIAPQGVQSL